MKINKEIIILIAIFIIAFFIRIWKLNMFPIGITHDELDYVINAKAIFLNGNSIRGNWSVFPPSSIKTNTALAELTPLLLAPIIGFLNLSLFNAKLPYTLFSSFLILIIYLITKELINKKVALIAALIMVVNPWSFHFGRTSFEAPFALFFIFLG
ncbi:hypothetical protein GYA19_02470, partial [Candidatus Beckwithbacteria bacterium]|nr:hypothetical protein [Candidatus Beckwithbacteria bacterium]